MRLWRGIALCTVLTAFLLSGCTYQRNVVLPEAGFPEEIYATPPLNHYYSAKVGVFPFKAPPYAPEAGKKAAKVLFRELVDNNVFFHTQLESTAGSNIRKSLSDIACDRNYDIIITGDVLYYLEGSLYQASKINMAIQVFRVKEGGTRLLWWAKATGNAAPEPSRDLIVLRVKGAPAPSAETLMRRNAEKFVEMLVKKPERQ